MADEDQRPKTIANAISAGHLPAVKRVVTEEGFDINAPLDGYEHRIIHLACTRKKLPILEWALENGANVNQLTEDHAHALRLAVNAEFVGGVRALLAVEGINIDEVASSGEVPVHKAIERRNLEILGLLVDAGADINSPDNKGSTPAMRLLEMWRKEDFTPAAWKLLEDSGRLDLSVSTAKGTAYHMAVTRETAWLDYTSLFTPETVGLTSEAHGGRSLLVHVLCSESRVRADAAELALAAAGDQADALVTATEAGGKTILHVATAAALPSLLAMDSVKQLVNTVDDDGLAPAHYRRSAERLELLIEAGADVNLLTPNRDTVLTHLCGTSESYNFPTSLIQVLTGSGLVEDINHVSDGNRRTALHYAAAAGSQEAIEALLAAGADRSVVDKKGKMPKDCTTNKALKKLLDDGTKNPKKRGAGDDDEPPPKKPKREVPAIEGSTFYALSNPGYEGPEGWCTHDGSMVTNEVVFGEPEGHEDVVGFLRHWDLSDCALQSDTSSPWTPFVVLSTEKNQLRALEESLGIARGTLARSAIRKKQFVIFSDEDEDFIGDYFGEDAIDQMIAASAGVRKACTKIGSVACREEQVVHPVFVIANYDATRICGWFATRVDT